ncbi:hypothetical protein ACFW0S_00015 [Citrobacter freundii]|uniref:hypothetical protein n=1 Tax=Citrobacter freundii TaxID=546 RepID=UPI0036725F04
MTTNNHPAHGPVSLDRLHQIREILSKAAAQSDGGDLGYAMADAVKVIDGAIAAFGAKPVGEVVLGEYDDCGRHPDARLVCIAADGQADWENFKDGTLLYAVTPAPLSIDERAAFNAWNNEDNLPIAGVGAKNAAWLAWQARAAMLHAGNSPETPDGWQLVPKEPTAAMNKAGWDAMNEHDAINPTYRAMLEAAPQQEVKSALEHGMQRYAGAMQKLSEGDK